MATFNDESLYQFIGNVTRSTNTTIATLPAGAVGLFDHAGTAVTSSIASSANPVRVVQKKADGTVLYSPFFTYAEILAVNQKAFTLDTQQVSYLGTNSAGTVTGLGTVTAGNAYIVDVEMLGSVSNTYTSPFIKTISYQASTGDTAALVAKGLFEAAVRVFNRAPVIPIRVDRIADGTGGTSVAAFTTATVAKFTKGSKIVNLYVKTAAANTGLTASTSGGALTTPVISVPSVDGKTFTFTALILGTGAGSHNIYIGDTSYYVADAGTAIQNASAIVAAINAGTQATAYNGPSGSETAAVTITYKAGTIGNLPPVVISSADNTTYATVAVTIASGDAKAVKYIANTVASGDATLTLDEPWQGETGYAYSGTTEATNVGVATLTTAGVWGLKFSGLALPFDEIVSKYELVRFAVKPKLGNQLINPITGSGYAYALGFDSSVVSYDVQLAKEGTGMYQEIAEMELLASQQNRAMTLQVYPPTKFSREATLGKEYSITAIRVKKVAKNSGVSQPNSYFTINIAVDKSLTTNDNDILRAVFGGITAIA